MATSLFGILTIVVIATAAAAETATAEQELMFVFQAADINGDRRLNRHEFQLGLEKLNVKNQTIDKLWTQTVTPASTSMGMMVSMENVIALLRQHLQLQRADHTAATAAMKTRAGGPGAGISALAKDNDDAPSLRHMLVQKDGCTVPCDCSGGATTCYKCLAGAYYSTSLGYCATCCASGSEFASSGCPAGYYTTNTAVCEGCLTVANCPIEKYPTCTLTSSECLDESLFWLPGTSCPFGCSMCTNFVDSVGTDCTACSSGYRMDTDGSGNGVCHLCPHMPDSPYDPYLCSTCDTTQCTACSADGMHEMTTSARYGVNVCIFTPVPCRGQSEMLCPAGKACYSRLPDGLNPNRYQCVTDPCLGHHCLKGYKCCAKGSAASPTASCVFEPTNPFDIDVCHPWSGGSSETGGGFGAFSN